jgi:Putative beta barrel porin-7 (BBP7)
MARWSKGAALLAVWMMGTASARAQAPHGPGAGTGEPTPLAGAVAMPAGVMTAGPGGCAAPTGAGCGPDLSLPAETPNAWDDRGYNCPACYFFIGPTGLQRQRPGVGSGITAFSATGGTPPEQMFHDIRPSMNWGIRGTAGYHWDDNAFELSGYYLFQNDSFVLNTASAGLGSPFVNPPLGFEAIAGLLPKDQIRTGLQTSIGSAEANYHWWLGPDSTFHWFAGARYLDVQEKVRISTGSGLSGGTIDPTQQASYTVRAHNHLIGPQLGFEHSVPLTCWLAFTYNARGVWAANILDQDSRLERGDGLVGRRGVRDTTVFSQAYEGGLFLDLCVCANVRFRGGYQLLWAVDIATAVRNVDFDLSNPLGMKKDDTGSVFYHGPVFELQVVF